MSVSKCPILLGIVVSLIAAPMDAATISMPGRSVDLTEKTWENLSNKELSDWGQKALAINAAKWKHGETDHFIVHFFRNGDMIGRRCEKFYGEIREFFGNRTDRFPNRKSHVFAFYESSDWSRFKTEVALGAYVAGVTRGNEFFYIPVNEDKQFDFRGKVQAHEMTHLIFNRLFTGQPPLWLNEGVAEYFGLKKTLDITTFRRTVGQPAPLGLERLFQSKEYPKDQNEIHSFYAEASIVIDFLTQTTDRRALLPQFIDAMISDNDVPKALKLYGFKSLDDFKKSYARYRVLFPRR